MLTRPIFTCGWAAGNTGDRPTTKVCDFILTMGDNIPKMKAASGCDLKLNLRTCAGFTLESDMTPEYPCHDAWIYKCHLYHYL